VTSGAATGALSSRNTPLAASVGDELLAIPGVAQVRPFRTVDLEFRGRTVKLLSTDVSVDPHAVRAGLVDDTAQDFIPQLTRGGVAVSENFARTFDVHAGDELALSTHDGLASFRVAGVIVNYTSDLGTVMVDRQTYIEHWGDPRVDTFEIYVAPRVGIQDLRAEITRRLGQRYDLFVLTNHEFRDEIVGAVSEVFKLLRVLVLVTSLMAVLGLTATALANVLYRVREFGVLRAIGMLRSQVSRMVILETAFIALAATLIGVVLGCGTAYVLLDRVISVELGWRFPFRLPAPVLALVLLLLPLTAAIAAYVPARRAAGLKTHEALSYE
jgi:putative ABC transport system permease protein